MARKLLERLRQGEVLIADGATGTMLQSMGLPLGESPSAWNLSLPEAVGQLAKAYADAGANLVYTNTFDANRARLARQGRERLVQELNTAAVRIAKLAVPEHVFVVGSIGPTCEMEPLGELSEEEVEDIFIEQAVALARAGVDAIVCETFSDLKELVAAARAVKGHTNLPLLCSMSFEMDGRTMMGVTPMQAVKALVEEGADVVGANCGGSLEWTEKVITQMRKVNPTVPILAKPNAGMPQLVDGKVFYPVTPEEMSNFAVRVVSAGANIVGGCCGSTPNHIAAIAKAVKRGEFI